MNVNRSVYIHEFEKQISAARTAGIIYVAEQGISARQPAPKGGQAPPIFGKKFAR